MRWQVRSVTDSCVHTPTGEVNGSATTDLPGFVGECKPRHGTAPIPVLGANPWRSCHGYWRARSPRFSGADCQPRPPSLQEACMTWRCQSSDFERCSNQTTVTAANGDDAQLNPRPTPDGQSVASSYTVFSHKPAQNWMMSSSLHPSRRLHSRRIGQRMPKLLVTRASMSGEVLLDSTVSVQPSQLPTDTRIGGNSHA